MGQSAIPLQVAIEIEARQVVGGIEGEDPLSIAGRSVRGGSAFGMGEAPPCRPKLAMPQLLARGRSEAEHMQSILIGPAAGCYYHAIFHHDGTGGSASGQVGRPADVHALLHVPGSG